MSWHSRSTCPSILTSARMPFTISLRTRGLAFLFQPCLHLRSCVLQPLFNPGGVAARDPLLDLAVHLHDEILVRFDEFDGGVDLFHRQLQHVGDVLRGIAVLQVMEDVPDSDARPRNSVVDDGRGHENLRIESPRSRARYCNCTKGM